MKPATIIYGPPGNLHTVQATNLARSLGSSYLYLSALDIPEDITLSDIPSKTVIIDDCPNDFDFEYYYNPITEASEKYFIFCVIKKPVKRGASFKDRFHLVDAEEMFRDMPF